MTTLGDVARWSTAFMAAFLIAVLLRLTWVRARRYGWAHQFAHPESRMAHPATTLGLVGFLGIGMVRQLSLLGHTPDGFTVAILCATLLTGYGVWVNKPLTFDFRPPWRRHGEPVR